MKKVIEKVSVNRKQYKVENYKEFFTDSKNLLIKNDAIECGYGYETASEEFLQKPTKMFVFDGEVYYQKGDKLCFLEGKKERVLTTIGTGETCATQIIYHGMRVNLFINAQGAYIVVRNLTASASWIDASVVTEHNGRLFSAKDRIISFSEPFDVDLQCVSMKVAGNLRVDRQAGNVIGFSNDGKTLYVFCQRAIYTLKTGFESIDFIFKKERNLDFEIKKDSLSTCADSVYFIGDNELYQFKKGKMTALSKLLNKDYKTGFASFYNGIYCLPVSLNDDHYLYLYDTKSGDESFISMQAEVACSGYYFLGDKLVKISREKSLPLDAKAASKTFCLSTNGEVDLYEICFCAGESGKLSIESKMGKTNFTVQKGFNAISTLLPSERYKIEFLSSKENFSIKELRLKYIEKGE